MIYQETQVAQVLKVEGLHHLNVLEWIPEAANLSPKCIRYTLRCYKFILYAARRTKWTRASQPDKWKSTVNLQAVVIFFDIPLRDQESFTLPPHVIQKVDDFAHCLFDD